MSTTLAIASFSTGLWVGQSAHEERNTLAQATDMCSARARGRLNLSRNTPEQGGGHGPDAWVQHLDERADHAEHQLAEIDGVANVHVGALWDREAKKGEQRAKNEDHGRALQVHGRTSSMSISRRWFCRLACLAS